MIAQTIEKTQESSIIAQAVMAKLQELPLEQQQEVLNFVESLAQKYAPRKTIWDEIREIVKDVPDEVWDSMPTDGALQHDHYLYGTPKKEV
ncbi:MAG: DUF2281 domain-containing protein [Hormoscilla sp. GUM202]|nr:DUF2281 domain-containing protein [Hormoscilla sp. GUM202]